MARRRKRRDSFTHIANDTLPYSYVPYTRLSPLTQIEDRRRFHPEGGLRPPMDVYGRPRRPQAIFVPKKRAVSSRSTSRSTLKSYSLFSPQAKMVFELPRETLVCVRRKRRREVMFAKRKAGRGGRQRSPRFNEFSSVRCRRRG